MERIAVLRSTPFIAGAVLLASCASEPRQAEPTTPADRMRNYAESQQSEVERKNELADQWERGQELVEEGERNIEESEEQITNAEREIREARDQITEGERKVEEGRRLMRDARDQFGQRAPDFESEYDSEYDLQTTTPR